MEIPLRITDNRTKSNLQKLFFGLFRQVISTSFSGRAFHAVIDLEEFAQLFLRREGYHHPFDIFL